MAEATNGGKAAADTSETEKGETDGNGRRVAIIGAATGIGSAALVAALLYANRGRGAKQGGREKA